jgi:hypothetical protein
VDANRAHTAALLATHGPAKPAPRYVLADGRHLDAALQGEASFDMLLMCPPCA